MIASSLRHSMHAVIVPFTTEPVGVMKRSWMASLKSGRSCASSNLFIKSEKLTLHSHPLSWWSEKAETSRQVGSNVVNYRVSSPQVNKVVTTVTSTFSSFSSLSSTGGLKHRGNSSPSSPSSWLDHLLFYSASKLVTCSICLFVLTFYSAHLGTLRFVSFFDGLCSTAVFFSLVIFHCCMYKRWRMTTETRKQHSKDLKLKEKIKLYSMSHNRTIRTVSPSHWDSNPLKFVKYVCYLTTLWVHIIGRWPWHKSSQTLQKITLLWIFGMLLGSTPVV